MIFQIIALLMQCGAHLHINPLQLGERMCAAATAGNVKRLKSYVMAGTDVSQTDASGRTPVHYATLHHHTEAIKYLLAPTT